jgi:hypothetical protein
MARTTQATPTKIHEKYSLPEIPFPKEPCVGPLRTKEVDGKMFYHADDLYHSVENEQIYGTAGTANWATSVWDLLPQFEESFAIKQNQFAVQLQPAIVYEDGLVDTGNTRTLAWRMFAAQHGLEPWVWASPKRKEQQPLSPYERMKELQASNITRQETPMQKLRRFNQYREAWCDEHEVSETSTIRVWPLAKLTGSQLASVKGIYEELTGMALSWTNMVMLDTILRHEDILKNQFPKDYDNGNWQSLIGKKKGFEYYHNLVTGKHTGGNVVPDKFPNRDWSVIFTKERLRKAAELTREYIASLSNLSLTVTGRRTTTNFPPFPSFEQSGVIPVYSHAFNVILAEVLRNDGFSVKTPKTNTACDFDLSFEFSGKDGLEWDKAEVKFATYNAGSTQWSGGHGVREGMFVLVAVEENWKSVFIATTRLNQFDWENAGQSGTKCKVSTVLDKHRQELQYAAGNLIEKSGGAVEVQTETL